MNPDEYIPYTSYMIGTIDTIHNHYTQTTGLDVIMSEQKTTIRVAESTKERLKNRGEMGMSYDDALNHVLDQLEELEDREDNE
jgi:predicted DNA binding CopG/RHH family protein